MNDRKEVIQCLEHCNSLAGCAECPYIKTPDYDCKLLDDTIALLKADTDIVERVRDVRDGKILKYVGNGVVMMNYDWWREMCEKDGFRIVPTPEQMSDAPNNGWVSVEDKLPETYDRVLARVYDKYFDTSWTVLGFYSGSGWYINANGVPIRLSYQARYWMPMPEAPKEDEE
jgi:hypothetical protein